MAIEIRQFTLTVPAGTPEAAPVAQDMSFPPRTVEAIQVVIPPGPSGVVGWQVLAGGVPVIPYASDLWVISANEIISWPLDNYPTSGAWSVRAYNTGVNDHSIYFRFLLGPAIGGVVPIAASPMIDDTALSAPEVTSG